MKQLLKNSFGLWLLISFNIYFIWYYRQHPESFKTLLLLYWMQSAAMGLFTFIQLLTVPINQVEIVENNGKPMSAASSRGCNGFFFLFHYGLFHLVYLIMLLVKTGGKIDFGFLKISFFIILIAEFMDFVRKKQAANTTPVRAGYIFFLPYLRIVPMHLMLVGASLSGWSDITIFLVLKTIADVAMHLLTNRLYFRSLAK
ncbi:DUF6498-containing protein [Phnomibacter sp. MR]|uniref:DUF6498-containing protein n=1 Tax=Phnomibacter sp. MR TaxID=3042318 RepID=UPI003A7FF876